MTEEEIIAVYLERDHQPTICGCLGAQPLPGESRTFVTVEQYNNTKRYPVCPCAMKSVVEDNGEFYRVDENDSTYTVKLIGPVGGPYNLDLPPQNLNTNFFTTLKSMDTVLNDAEEMLNDPQD